jgi:hypothetical protein
MRRGIKNGAKMVVVDPRKIDQVKKADKWLPVNVGTDICLANAMANVIIEEDLYNKKFVERATENFEALKEKVAGYTPSTPSRSPGTGGRHPRGGPDVRHGGEGDPELDFGHHRAPQRGGRGLRPDKPRAPHRPHRQIRLRTEPAARPEQRPGWWRHGGVAGQDGRRLAVERPRGARALRGGLGHGVAREGRQEPGPDARCDKGR